jgi:hypothetical protein
MTTLEVQSQVSFDTLLNSLQQLSSEELTKLAQHAARLEAQRKARSLSEAEAKLLFKINRGIVPLKARQRCASLTAKSRAGAISDEEHAELMGLVDKIERLNAQRLKYLARLAQLRGVTLDNIVDMLEISPLTYE